MTDLYIPDVSEFQGNIDWPNFGADAVIVRINYGNSKVDADADRNIDGARSRCKVRGWYCYLIGSDDPVVDADVFCRVLQAHGGLQPNEFVVCDDEEGVGDQSPRVNAFLDECDKQLNTPNPTGEDWWYSGLNFSIAHNLAGAKGHRWIAAYQASEPTALHDLWQFTDAASVAGVSGPVDMSVFHGDINQLITLLGVLREGDMAAAPRPDGSQIDYFIVKPGDFSLDHYTWTFAGGLHFQENLAGILVPNSISACWVGVELVVFGQGPDGTHFRIVWDGTAWGSWASLGVKGALPPPGPQGPPGPSTYVPHKHNMTITETETGTTDSGTPG